VFLLSVHNVSKSFPSPAGPLQVVKDLSLSVRSGEVISLCGPSGSGKTTMLRMIAGLEMPSSGQINYGDYTPSEGVGFIFQDPVLLPWRTAFENVRLALELGPNQRVEDIGSAINELLTQVGLREFAHYHPRALSGGMKARVALARALVRRPQLLLLDEPFASVDELTRSTLYATLASLVAKLNIACVLVTHSIYEAVLLSDRVLALSPRPASVLQEYNVEIGLQDRLSDPDNQKLGDIRRQVRAVLATVQVGGSTASREEGVATWGA